MVHPFTRNKYQPFITQREFAVVHFDAEWDVGGRPPMRMIMSAASQEFADIANFGEIDVDREGELSKSIPVMNVPLIAYYRRGELIAALIGLQQNVAERLRCVIRGEPIGYKDETGVAPVLRMPDSPFRWKF